MNWGLLLWEQEIDLHYVINLEACDLQIWLKQGSLDRFLHSKVSIPGVESLLSYFAWGIHPTGQNAIGKQGWETGLIVYYLYPVTYTVRPSVDEGKMTMSAQD